MSFKTHASAIALAALAASAFAQAPAPAANPMDAIPERMPFDVPYGAPISLEKADAALAAAVNESRARNWKLVCAVVDSGGNMVSLKRMDGAQLASVEIASHKARTAATFRRETKVFEAGIQGGNNYLITLPGVIGSRGGIPLVEAGKIVGAIGCSGGTGSQDEVASRAGVATVK